MVVAEAAAVAVLVAGMAWNWRRRWRRRRVGEVHEVHEPRPEVGSSQSTRPGAAKSSLAIPTLFMVGVGVDVGVGVVGVVR